MVFFVCEGCNETVKKNQVEKHVFKCKNCYAGLCLKYFSLVYLNCIDILIPQLHALIVKFHFMAMTILPIYLVLVKLKNMKKAYTKAPNRN
jgi:hypothetical protein